MTGSPRERQHAAWVLHSALDEEYRRVWRTASRQELDSLLSQMHALFIEATRAHTEAIEEEFPEGPDLNQWTVESIRRVPYMAWEPFLADVERLRRGTGSPESSIRWLEADIWDPGSGWLKEKVLRYVMRSEISTYEERLRGVVLTAVRDPHHRRELFLYARLAKRVMNSELHEKLEFLAIREGAAAGHARYVLRVIDEGRA
jgi:hypothetical protein